MAFVSTTLSSKVLFNDHQIVVTSATNFAANQLVRIDDEIMRIAQNYASGTTIPVIRGIMGSAVPNVAGGTAGVSHVATANVYTDALSDNLWAVPGVGTDIAYRPWGLASPITSVSATSTLTLPTAGTIARVILNGTSVITLTVPLPTVDMDGTILFIASNGAAAHVVTFTSTLNNAGSGYTSFTNNASGTMALMVIACNGFWTVPCFPAWTGTVTKVTGGIA